MTRHSSLFPSAQTMPEGWTALSVPDIAQLPGAVMLRAETIAPRHAFPRHTHAWNQLVYATHGALVVSAEGARHVITPEQAVWVPTGTQHDTGAPDGAEFRNLYVADVPGLHMPQVCTVYAVAPLLRALILELVAIEGRGESPAYVERLNALIIDQLHRMAPLDFYLPWPVSAPLARMCEAIYAAPNDARRIEQWAEALAISARTLGRRFEREVGLSWRAWRYRLRLFRAVEWLGAGRRITDIAYDLGYESPAAFTYMFRKEMGRSPSRYVAGGL